MWNGLEGRVEVAFEFRMKKSMEIRVELMMTTGTPYQALEQGLN